MAAEGLAKVGLTTDAWVKMWEEGFEDEHHGDEEHCGHGDTHRGDHKHQHDHGDHHQHHHGHEEHHHGHGDHHHHEHGHGDEDEYEGHGHGKVDRYLQKYLPQLVGDKPTASVLVSMCGDSPDLVWLSEQGHTVVGIEVAEKAVKDVFENVPKGAIPHSVTTEGDFKVYTATNGKNLKVYVGDFLLATPEKVGTFDIIWDSHGVISVPVELHPSFVEVFCKLLKPGGKILLSTTYFNIEDLHKWPAPCPLGMEEAKKLFPSEYEIELLDNPKLPGQQKEFELPWITNPIMLLTPKI